MKISVEPRPEDMVLELKEPELPFKIEDECVDDEETKMVNIRVKRKLEEPRTYSLQDFKQIICSVYCKCYNSADSENTKCKSCSINPKNTINFELGTNVKELAEMGVLHDGGNILIRYQKAEMTDLFKKFELEAK